MVMAARAAVSALNIFFAKVIELACCKSSIYFLSDSEKSPSGPIRIQTGPSIFFDKILFKLFLLQFISQ